MQEIEIIAFGITREILGTRSLKLDWRSGITVAELLDLLQTRYPQLHDLAHVRVAVNQEYAELDHKIQASDEVVLIPPVSGG